ncbi:MAG: hypothetical protein QW272_09095 [Candidatus Methanomethylicaceae archaeon]
MKSISVFAIVSIIAILLIIGLIYFIVKPIKPITTTTTSFIPTTYTETITETAYIPTTYIITTTYTLTTTYQTPLTTITKTITEIITYTYVPEEKIEITFIQFTNPASPPEDMALIFHFVNKEYSSIYIDPKRPVKIYGRGLLRNDFDPDDVLWIIGTTIYEEPFILPGSPYNPQEARFDGLLRYNRDFNPKEIKKGGVYTVIFDYKVIYLNGTMSDWKSFTFNATWKGKEY